MRYKLEKQEKDYWCFPACLQAVLREHELGCSQGKIAEELKLDETGASLESVSDFLRTKGFDFNFYNYNEVPFNEPDSLIENNRHKNIIIAVANSKGYHVLLLEEFRFPNIVVREPRDTEAYRTDLYKLMRSMHHKKQGGFGLIEKLY